MEDDLVGFVVVVQDLIGVGGIAVPKMDRSSSSGAVCSVKAFLIVHFASEEETLLSRQLLGRWASLSHASLSFGLSMSIVAVFTSANFSFGDGVCSRGHATATGL